jgi:hypothetical protein
VNAPQPRQGSAARRRRVPPAGAGNVVTLDRVRIERALGQRQRYRYVQPRVVAEGSGWKVLSPNCSRNIDPDGGEIPIAWFEPQADGRWALHRCDHRANAWCEAARGITLDDALERLCTDALGRFWP